MAEFFDRPSKEPEWKVIHQIADKAVGKVATLIRQVFDSTRKAILVGNIANMIDRGEALDAVAAADRAWLNARRNLQADLGKLLRGILERAGEASLEAIRSSFVQKQQRGAGGVQISFDVTNQAVFEWIRTETASLVKDIDAETRASIEETIFRAFNEGIPPVRAAKIIRENIGLNRRGALAVDNLELALRRTGPLMTELAEFESLPKHLQDKIIRARSVGLARKGQIEEILDRYRQRLIRERAMNIARTETINASSAGQGQLWSQMSEQRLLDTSRLEVAWLLTPDDRTCVRCQNQRRNYPRRPIHGVYANGVRGPTLHPSCRCSERLLRKKAA